MPQFACRMLGTTVSRASRRVAGIVRRATPGKRHRVAVSANRLLKNRSVGGTDFFNRRLTSGIRTCRSRYRNANRTVRLPRRCWNGKGGANRARSHGSTRSAALHCRHRRSASIPETSTQCARPVDRARSCKATCTSGGHFSCWGPRLRLTQGSAGEIARAWPAGRARIKIARQVGRHVTPFSRLGTPSATSIARTDSRPRPTCKERVVSASHFVSMASGRSIRPACQPEFQGRHHHYGPSAPPISPCTGNADAMSCRETVPRHHAGEHALSQYTKVAFELWFGDTDVLYSRRSSGIIRARGYILRGSAERATADDWKGATGWGVAHIATCPNRLIRTGFAGGRGKSRKRHSEEASIRLAPCGSARGSHTLTTTSLLSKPGHRKRRTECVQQR